MRIRRATTKRHSGIDWFLTFKCKEADRTIEIENPISARDGEQLWPSCYWTLRKERFVYKFNGLNWEIDLFKNNDQVYFILAEVELSENAPRPKIMPPILKKHLLYEVPLTDARYSNKKLGNVEYATKVYKQLILKEDRDVYQTA